MKKTGLKNISFIGKIKNPEHTVFPRKDELIMLPEDSSNKSKHTGIKSVTS